MERRPPSEPKRSGKEKARKGAAAAAADGGDEEEVAAGEEEDKKRRPPAPAPASSAARRGSGGGGASQPCCQAEKCTADLTEAKRYHRRHKVCEAHSKAPVVIVAGLRQRFCQQCSRGIFQPTIPSTNTEKKKKTKMKEQTRHCEP
ncbi:uncharacterized protein [Elaeis guineensis]|uniref:Squamosa promoter-binding-like protein 13 isoform X3 n=1 Tax=Elaeis guineensis var. tenera TaxID=51953 RepID=A0A6I9RN71_ELAGV|nr:squamosa promoter-binding-like protein 13 isoform X3 [Elaeis guineensis]